DTKIFKPCLETCKMNAALITQIVQLQWCPFDESLTSLILAVGYPQRIFLKPVVAVRAQCVQKRSEILLQFLQIGLPAGGTAYTVDIEPGLFQSQLLEKHVEYADDLHIDLRPGCTQCLDPELVEFPVAPLLDIFISVGSYVIVKLYRLRERIHAIFDVAAYHTGSPFRPKRDAPAAFIVEG